MRTLLGLLVVGSLSLVACGGADDGGGILRGGQPIAAPAAPAPAPAAAAPVDPAASCPAATALSSTDTNAQDLHLIPGFVVYRQETSVIEIDAKGTRSALYTSPDLVHSYIDADVLVTIESPNPPDAVLKVMPAGKTTGADPTKMGAPLTVTPDNWSAGGTTVFASDATSLYILADVATQGDTIYKVSKADPTQMTVLAVFDGGASLGDAQLVGTDIWFVRDQKRVYQVKQTPADPGAGTDATASDPAEIFGIGYANCNLAVGGSHAYCSTGTALEQRDLTGANLQTVFDGQKGADPTLLGAAIFGTDTVFVRSLPSSATDTLKNGIRAVKGTDATVVACGRETINAFTANDTLVVWTEQGKGVFSAPR